jgi:hypothetical protein
VTWHSFRPMAKRECRLGNFDQFLCGESGQRQL